MSDLSNSLMIDGGGAVLVAALGPVGMVTVKADFTDKNLAARVAKTLGVALPKPRRINKGVAWMAPDELLVFTQKGVDPDTLATKIDAALGHAGLALNVSDSRAVFALKGEGAREVLAKGAPVDLATSAFGQGSFRRTRLGQVAVAFWMEAEDEFRLVCFTSMREFMFDWLVNAAQKDSLPGHL